MPCIPSKFKNGTIGFSCMPNLYRFKGWFFERHSYCGPWPLRKDGELRKRAGNKFWKMVEEFEKLSKEQKEKYAS